mmetsp:Transcript_9278/g.34628  ORF Transcript_9278/g.34628 Transcript_9278/m.34628 type:complete len:240 (+) Transcript_9278:7388-8107(+)
MSSCFIVFSSATRHSLAAFSTLKCGSRHIPRHVMESCATSLSSALTCFSSERRTASPTPPSSARTARPPPSASLNSLSHSRNPFLKALPARKVPSSRGASYKRNNSAICFGFRAANAGAEATHLSSVQNRVHRSTPCSSGKFSATALARNTFLSGSVSGFRGFGEASSSTGLFSSSSSTSPSSSSPSSSASYSFPATSETSIHPRRRPCVFSAAVVVFAAFVAPSCVRKHSFCASASPS